MFAGEPSVLSKISTVDEVFLPTIVLGELYYGAQKSVRREENLQQIQELAAVITVIGVDQSVAENYGRIKNSLRVKGKPIPENDIWIAAVAQTFNLDLATRDLHFNEIDDLTQLKM